jgi:hypothetical protein
MTIDTTQFPPFDVNQGELAPQHKLIDAWTQQASNGNLSHSYYTPAKFSDYPAGAPLQAATPKEAILLLLAAIQQNNHYRPQADLASKDDTSMNWFNNKPALALRARICQTGAVVIGLLRKALPMQEQDLSALLTWYQNLPNVPDQYTAGITKAITGFLDTNPGSPEIRSQISAYAKHIKGSPNKKCHKLAVDVEQLLVDHPAKQTSPTPADPQPTPQPAAPKSPSTPVLPTDVGHPAVLTDLKVKLGLLHEPQTPPVTQSTELDYFPVRQDSPLKEQHEFITGLLAQLQGKNVRNDNPKVAAIVRQALSTLSDQAAGQVVLAAAEREFYFQLAGPDAQNRLYWISNLLEAFVNVKYQLDPDSAAQLALYVGTRSLANAHSITSHNNSILAPFEALQSQGKPLSQGHRYALHVLRTGSITTVPLGAPSEFALRISSLIENDPGFFLIPGEAWSDTLNADIAALDPKIQQHFIGLLKHCLGTSSSRPNAKWIKTAQQYLSDIGQTQAQPLLAKWFSLVPKGRSIWNMGPNAQTMPDQNADCLRGLLWASTLLPSSDDMARAIGSCILWAYKKLPGVGARAVKIGNSGVYALSEMATPFAVGQLAMLKARVKFGTAQIEIEKAFNAAAQALGIPRDQIEEMGVPTYGLQEVGLARETFGEFTCQLRVDGSQPALHWQRADGKDQKSVPAWVKENHKEELKDLQASVKDITLMIGAQAQRLDSLFLLEKQWPVALWRERYLDHPLVGTLARRLIWVLYTGNHQRAAIWHSGQFVGPDDKPITLSDAADTHIQLWHPIARPISEVVAWRNWLTTHQILQPFKQAFREVYPLTDAERRTNTYSNRFAAHVIRQHQFAALCSARGWKNKLRLMVDDTYPPATKELTHYGLRAEFWIEGIGTDYGVDTNEAGSFLRLATDQVRFYRAGAATVSSHAFGGSYTSNAAGPGTDNINNPLPLDQVPALAFSEIMRDVDLFVGVASVGNDPTWQDGGPDGRFREYWQSYSFGELSQVALTRRSVLESLLPRLTKIKARCTLTDKFLIVKGDIRTYKIHLGSGNILMEPNDQYLCIVPDKSNTSADASAIFLPFDGDATLSIILSKAFLLAADTKIKDPTITRQISG